MTPKEMRAERRRSSDIEIDGPFGIKARFFGKEITSVLLLALCALGIAWLIYQHDTNSADRIKLVAENQRALYEQMGDMIYILKLSEKERESLNLTMPDSLRKKLRDGQ